jgi:CIC family chloride channel protein
MVPELPLRLPRIGRTRLYDWLRGSPTGLVALALTIGTGAGLGAVAFRYLILWFTVVFSGHADYSAAGHEAHPWLPALGAWFVVLAPVVGGLIYGPLVSRWAPEARGHGVPEVMLAIAQLGGRIRPRVAVVKSLASALCIGCGGSVGREGPIVQIGSALGSSLGQWLRIPDSRLRLLVACGAAGGISSTFNAPIAGVVFALELLLRDIEAESFGIVVLASVLADVVGRAVFGAAPFLVLPPFRIVSVWEYPLYAALGVLAGVVGVVFIRVLYGAEDLADWLWRGPEWLRPAAGGLLLGALLLAVPQMYGVGYPVLEGAIRESYTLRLLVLLLVSKIAATSLTIAIGGSGGVFAPSLFMGAMMGTAFGQIVHTALPASTALPGAYGIVAMGAVFAGAARAPMTAVIIIFELTGEYQIILPLMAAVALAAGVSNLLSPDTIYTLKLRRRGIDLARAERSPLHGLTVENAMQPVPAPLLLGDSLQAAAGRFARDPGLRALPVADERGRYRGALLLTELEQRVREGDGHGTTGDLAVELPTVDLHAPLDTAIDQLVHSRAPGLPVLDEAHAVVGWLTQHDVLRVYTGQRGASPPAAGASRRASSRTSM